MTKIVDFVSGSPDMDFLERCVCVYVPVCVPCQAPNVAVLCAITPVYSTYASVRNDVCVQYRGGEGGQISRKWSTGGVKGDTGGHLRVRAHILRFRATLCVCVCVCVSSAQHLCARAQVLQYDMTHCSLFFSLLLILLLLFIIRYT